MKNSSFLIACSLFFLSGCGFSPIYASWGDNAPVAQDLNNVQIASIEGRQGQILRNHLIDRMYGQGKPTTPSTRLEVHLRSSESDLGVMKDATASRRQYNLWADYVLRSVNGNELAKGTCHSLVSFSKMDAQYGTLLTEKNAQERATTEVGEQLVNRLSAYFAEKAHDNNPDPS